MERAADGAEKHQAEGSEVVKYRTHEDGTLQAEVRTYTRRDGGLSERGAPERRTSLKIMVSPVRIRVPPLKNYLQSAGFVDGTPLGI